MARPLLVDYKTVPIISATAPPAQQGAKWYDTTYGIEKVYNAVIQDWDPAADHILDRAAVSTYFTVPTTAVSQATAAQVTGLVITPNCPPGPLRLKAWVWLDHGTAGQGWATGRSMSAFIGDTTLSSTAPVMLGGIVSSLPDVAHGVVRVPIEFDVQISAEAAGTRTYALYAYLSSSLLTFALVYADNIAQSWLAAEIHV